MSMIWLKGSPPYLDTEERASQMKLLHEIRRLYMIGCCAMNPMVVLCDSCNVFLPIDSVSTCFCGKVKGKKMYDEVELERLLTDMWHSTEIIDRPPVIQGRWIGGGWRCRKRMMMKRWSAWLCNWKPLKKRRMKRQLISCMKLLEKFGPDGPLLDPYAVDRMLKSESSNDQSRKDGKKMPKCTECQTITKRVGGWYACDSCGTKQDVREKFDPLVLRFTQDQYWPACREFGSPPPDYDGVSHYEYEQLRGRLNNERVLAMELNKELKKAEAELKGFKKSFAMANAKALCDKIEKLEAMLRVREGKLNRIYGIAVGE